MLRPICLLNLQNITPCGQIKVLCPEYSPRGTSLQPKKGISLARRCEFPKGKLHERGIGCTSWSRLSAPGLASEKSWSLAPRAPCMIMTRRPRPPRAAPASPGADRWGREHLPAARGPAPGVRPPRVARAPPLQALRGDREQPTRPGGCRRGGPRGCQARIRSPSARPGDGARGGEARGSRSPLRRPQPSRRRGGDSARGPRSREDAEGRRRLRAPPAARPRRTALRRRQPSPAPVAKPPVRSEGSAPRLPPQFSPPRRGHLFVPSPQKDHL